MNNVFNDGISDLTDPFETSYHDGAKQRVPGLIESTITIPPTYDITVDADLHDLTKLWITSIITEPGQVSGRKTYVVQRRKTDFSKLFDAICTRRPGALLEPLPQSDGEYGPWLKRLVTGDRTIFVDNVSACYADVNIEKFLTGDNSIFEPQSAESFKSGAMSWIGCLAPTSTSAATRVMFECSSSALKGMSRNVSASVAASPVMHRRQLVGAASIACSRENRSPRPQRWELLSACLTSLQSTIIDDFDPSAPDLERPLFLLSRLARPDPKHLPILLDTFQVATALTSLVPAAVARVKEGDSGQLVSACKLLMDTLDKTLPLAANQAIEASMSNRRRRIKVANTIEKSLPVDFELPLPPISGKLSAAALAEVSNIANTNLTTWFDAASFFHIPSPPSPLHDASVRVVEAVQVLLDTPFTPSIWPAVSRACQVDATAECNLNLERIEAESELLADIIANVDEFMKTAVARDRDTRLISAVSEHLGQTAPRLAKLEEEIRAAEKAGGSGGGMMRCVRAWCESEMNG